MLKNSQNHEYIGEFEIIEDGRNGKFKVQPVGNQQNWLSNQALVKADMRKWKAGHFLQSISESSLCNTKWSYEPSRSKEAENYGRLLAVY